MKLWLLCPLFLEATSQVVALVNVLDRYPGYAGAYNITGSVTISAAVNGSYQFDVLAAGGVPNGNHTIHVHSGVSCDAATLVGGHFWQPFPTPDPWTAPYLTADASGMINGSFAIDFGFTEEFFIRHALVIHDPSSARVACGVIGSLTGAPPPFLSAQMATYPNYNGSLTVTGVVEVWDVMDGLMLNFRLAGVENNVMGGVHIHNGTTCETSGPHYWLNQSAADPWTTKYTSNTTGNLAVGALKIMTGYPLMDNMYHAVVIHDAANVRVACGLLGGPMPTTAPTSAPTEPPTPAPTEAPTSAPTSAPSTTVAPTSAPTAPPTAAPTMTNSTTNSTTNCPTEEIEGVYTSCRVYDFTGATCSEACAGKLAPMVSAFQAGAFNLTEATACLDWVNNETMWINGDLATLKSRLNYDTAICNTTVSEPTSSAMRASALLAAVPLFFL